MKKKIIVIINIIILIILFSTGVYFYYDIKIKEENNPIEHLATLNNEIYFEPYKLQDDNLTILIQINYEDGIKTITDQYNNKILNCYGKTSIVMDYKINYNEDKTYTFVLEKSNGEKIQKDLIVNEDYRNSIIKTKLTFEDDNNYFNIEIDQEENNKYYYRFDENEEWKEYTGIFVETSFAIDSWYNIDENGMTNIYLKKVYDNKEYNEIIIKKDIQIQKKPELITEINNIDDLQTFTYQVNSGATFANKKVNLNTNIDLSGICYEVDGTVENDINWMPIGINIERTDDIIVDYETTFSGEFNGNGKEITGLYINTENDIQGLFGCINYGGKINDLIVSGKIKGNSNIGGICGYIKDGTLQNCKNKVDITATGDNIGGLIGIVDKINKEVVKYCCNEGNITSSGTCVGGIIRKFWCK